MHLRLGEGRRVSWRSGDSSELEGIPLRHFLLITMYRIRRARSGRRVAFTMVEAVVAMLITAIAGAALLLGISSAMQTTLDAQEQLIAMGIAQQLLDEVAGARLCASADLGSAPTPGTPRSQFVYVDDYNVARQVPVDPWGVALGEDAGDGTRRHANFRIPGGLLDRWREEIRITYLEPDLVTPTSGGQKSDYRLIEVAIYFADPQGGERRLCVLRQVVTYVPPP